MISDEQITRYWCEVWRAEQEQRLAALTPAQLADLIRELYDLRVRLAEHERTQATGGPPPPETRTWANERIVPPPESASRRDMDPPTRYGASNQKRSQQ